MGKSLEVGKGLPLGSALVERRLGLEVRIWERMECGWGWARRCLLVGGVGGRECERVEMG